MLALLKYASSVLCVQTSLRAKTEQTTPSITLFYGTITCFSVRFTVFPTNIFLFLECNHIMCLNSWYPRLYPVFLHLYIWMLQSEPDCNLYLSQVFKATMCWIFMWKLFWWHKLSFIEKHRRQSLVGEVYVFHLSQCYQVTFVVSVDQCLFWNHYGVGQIINFTMLKISARSKSLFIRYILYTALCIVAKR